MADLRRRLSRPSAFRGTERSPSEESNPKGVRRRQFVEAALRVFIRKGYRNAGILDIANEVGVSSGLFYSYFADKRAVFMEAVDEAFRRIQEQTAAALAGERSFFRRMMYRSEVFHENYLRHAEIFYQLRAEAASEEEWPREKIREIYRKLTEPVVEEIGEAIGRGEIRAVDADLLAWALTGIMEVMCVKLALFKEHDLNRVMLFVHDLLSKGLRRQED